MDKVCDNLWVPGFLLGIEAGVIIAMAVIWLVHRRRPVSNGESRG